METKPQKKVNFKEAPSKSEKKIPRFVQNSNKEEVKIVRSSKKSKTIKQDSSPCDLNYGEYLNQNEQFNDYMEDYVLSINSFNKEGHKHLFCVFDGHGGDETAKLCVKRYPEIFAKCLTDNPFDYELAIKQSFSLMDKEVEELNATEMGNTATVVFIVNKLLYCSNVGDSSCCLISEKKGEFLSIDDKIVINEKETNRIKKCGGEVIDDRLNGVLCITRGIGDFDMKKKGLICEPHIAKKLIDHSLKYCVIASDGVWDVIKPKDAHKIAMELNDPKKIAQKLVEEAMARGSEDNISCICVELNKQICIK